MPLYYFVAEKAGKVTHEETLRAIQVVRDKVIALNRRGRRIGLAATGIGGGLLVVGLLILFLYGATVVRGEAVEEATAVLIATLGIGPLLIIVGLFLLFKTRKLPYYLR